MKETQMKNDNGLAISTVSSYWSVFRIFFVIFSLYFVGMSFYSWDGFRYYGSFPDFLSCMALILILWCALAVILAICIWIPFKLVEWVCLRMGWKIRIEPVLMFMIILMILGTGFWKGSTRISRSPYYQLVKNEIKLILTNNEIDTNQVKFVMLLVAVIILFSVTITLAKLFRNKAVSWINVVQERITPLVWIFVILTILAVPLVAYDVAANHTWGKEDKGMLPGARTRQGSSAEKPNIVLVTFDALTARNMSLYGYHRETTPFINEWAENATVFSMAQAMTNYTTPTTATLMTGKRMWTHQILQPHGYGVKNATTESLPLLLKNNGYYNIALIQNTYASVNTLGISNGFDIDTSLNKLTERTSIQGVILQYLFQLYGYKYHRYNWLVRNAFIFDVVIRKIPKKVTLTEYPPEKVFKEFFRIMDNIPPEPFFAWIHIMPPHDPYLPPEPFMGMYDSSPELRTEQSQWSNPEFDISRARYDEFIRYCDKEFENFIKELSKYNKNLVIVFSSDHGHSFEHGWKGHGGPHLYEQLTNIPLIIKEVGQTKGKVINDVVEQVDIAPTILELVNMPVPGWMEGRSLVPLLQRGDLSSEPALSMVLEGTPKGELIKEGTFAAWEGDYKFIHYLKENKSLLFNLKQDPDELTNLVDQEPEIAQHLLAYIKINLKKANKKIEKWKKIAE